MGRTLSVERATRRWGCGRRVWVWANGAVKGVSELRKSAQLAATRIMLADECGCVGAWGWVLDVDGGETRYWCPWSEEAQPAATRITTRIVLLNTEPDHP